MGLSPQVLPVMRVDAVLFIVIIRPWAPGCLEVEYVKISVLRLDVVKKVNSNFIFRMRESAHLSILAIFHIIRISLTELTLVLFGMVELFDPVMRLQAILSAGDALVMSCAACDLRAHLAGVRA